MTLWKRDKFLDATRDRTTIFRVVFLAANSLYITMKAEGACSSKRPVFMSKHTRCENPKDHHLTNVDFLTTQKFKVTRYRDVQIEGKDRGESGPVNGLRTINGLRVKPRTFS